MTQQIEDYLVVSATGAEELTGKVRRYLEEGYQPYGSPYNAGGYGHNQAMVRYRKEDSRPEDLKHRNEPFKPVSRGRMPELGGELGEL